MKRTPALGMVPAVVALSLLCAAPTAAQELTLREALAAAGETHPALATAGARVDAADATLVAARAQRLPYVAGSAGLTRFQEPMLVAPLHAFDPTNIPDFDRSLVRGEIGARYTLFEGGARSARIRGADAMADASRWGARATEARVVEEVTGAYLSVLTARAVQEAATRQRRALEAEARRAQQQLDEGTAPRVEVLRAEAALLDSRARETTAESAVGLAERALARLMGVDPGALVGRPLRPVALEEAGVGDATHPLVERSRRGVGAARARVDQERAALLPRLSASAGLLDYGTLTGDHVAEWQAGVQISWPIFTGGARGAAIRRAEAELAAAEEELRLLRLDVANATDAAEAAVLESASRAEALAAAVTQWEEVARIEALSLAEGAGVQSDLLRAEAGLFQARAGYARARHDAVLAAVRLAGARGALDMEWITSALETVR